MADVVRAMAEPLGKVDKITIVSTGNDGAVEVWTKAEVSPNRSFQIFRVRKGAQAPSRRFKFQRI